MICIEYDHAFAKDMTQKFVAYEASSASASATSEPSSSGVSKSPGKNMVTSAVAVPKPPTVPKLLQDKPFPTYQDPFESDADESDDLDFELDASTPKVSTDRKLRPRASRVITIED